MSIEPCDCIGVITKFQIVIMNIVKADPVDIIVPSYIHRDFPEIVLHFGKRWVEPLVFPVERVFQ